LNHDLRECLGRFATGVTVVTCRGSEGPCGITANSFSSVSLEPPLVLWNIAKVSNSLQAYLDAEYFAINVLAAGQQELSSHFAQSDHTVFNGIDYDTSDRGVPLLPDSVARFECRTNQVHDCGDHYIIVGEVESYRSDEREPLLFYNGRYAFVRAGED
jgi:flavin reductase (DIM6/NTAB) family NADH-FMN oxidoreductase RutF